ncbi:hypothetical protein PI124_g14956 [Phytophthora idaei]|nr:hypothetical protein PI125_g12576 [Phytophthora idaei]KAG3240136.1 hypothetical protein PI124_g14956 [Phytophthora idaei]
MLKWRWLQKVQSAWRSSGKRRALVILKDFAKLSQVSQVKAFSMDLVPGLLLEVGKLCDQMRENEEICRHLHLRATLFWDHVRKMSAEDIGSKQPVLFEYKVTLEVIRTTLRNHQKRNLFIRIWGNHKVVGKLQKLYEKMDDLYKLMGLEHMQSMAEFRVEFHRMADQGFQELARCAESIDVIREVILTDEWREGLVAMASVAKQEENQGEATSSVPIEQVELARSTFHRAKSVLAEMNEKMPMIPKWFIPRDAVEFDDETYFERGAYATAHVGTWGENGLGTEVVVKCLVADNDKAQEEFRRESTVWYGLDHPNVVKMYGACHEGMPIFFVCEYVKGGNFVDLFEKDKTHLWRLFYSAALGLRYLHDKNIVHGDLKCNNILVEPTKDGKKAKICDFGFSYVRDRSQMSAKAKTQTIRWQAPEVLMPFDQEEHDHEYNPRFASDVYSFGMCIIEAFLNGETPYGTDDDMDVMEKILSGEPPPRPYGLQDDEWAFVLRLCAHFHKARLTISDALRTLKMFADREAQANPSVATLECLKCNTRLPPGANFCMQCGTRANTA